MWTGSGGGVVKRWDVEGRLLEKGKFFFFLVGWGN